MADDVTLRISADNSGLNQSTKEAESIVSESISRIENNVNNADLNLKVNVDDGELKRTKIDAQALIDQWSQGIEIDIDDGPLKDLLNTATDVSDTVDDWPSKAAAAASSFLRIASIAGTVWTVGKKITDTIIEWEKEASGFNDALERSKVLQEQILDQAKERLGLRTEQAKSDPKILEELEKELELINQRKIAAQERLQNAKNSFNRRDQAEPAANRVEEQKNNVARFLAEKEMVKARASLTRLNEEEKRLAEAIEPIQKRKLQDEQELVDKKKELLRQYQREIDIANMRTAETDGNSEAAKQLREKMRREDNERKFGSLGGGEAERVTAAQKASEDRKESAKSVADARKANEEIARDRERFEKATERHAEKVAGIRERNAQKELGIRKDFVKLQDRQSRERQEENRAIGGFDSSLQGAISRIQNSASTPRDDKEAERHREIKDFETDAKHKRQKMVEALEKIANNPPEKPKGLR